MKSKEYLKILQQTFKDFVFFEEDHHYEFKGSKVGISVTKLISEYANQFDSEVVASRIAMKEGKTTEQVLKEWKAKNEWSCEKGHLCHCFAQEIWKHQLPKLTWYPDQNKTDIMDKIYSQANNFYNDYCEQFEHLADEFVIGSEEYDIASAVDHLFVDKKTDELVMIDYKTNRDIYKNDKYAKKMKPPLNNLLDTTLNHYKLQLSIYKYIIEKYSKLKIKNMFIVWFSELNDNYEIIKVKYLKKEVEELLEWRKWE